MPRMLGHGQVSCLPHKQQMDDNAAYLCRQCHYTLVRTISGKSTGPGVSRRSCCLSFRYLIPSRATLFLNPSLSLKQCEPGADTLSRAGP